MIVNERPGFTIEAIHAQLVRALRHGGRAAHLVRYAPGLVDLMCPAGKHQRPPHERALVTEDAIRSAIRSLGGRADVLAVVLGLAPGTLELTLEERRQRAAAVLGILPATFRRDRHEGLLLWDLATEIYRRADEGGAGQEPGPVGRGGGLTRPLAIAVTCAAPVGAAPVSASLARPAAGADLCGCAAKAVR